MSRGIKCRTSFRIRITRDAEYDLNTSCGVVHF
jgi:hypothetical protein